VCVCVCVNTDDGMSSSKSSSVLPSSSVDTTSGDEHDVIRARDTVSRAVQFLVDSSAPAARKQHWSTNHVTRK